MINQDIIAQDLFYKIRSRFPKMEMGDENGQPTYESTKGRFFDFDAVFEDVNLGTVSISINEPGSLKIYFSRNILETAEDEVSRTWFKFLREMRKFAMKRLMSFDTRDITKTNLDKRDYNYLANKESVMNESSVRGTSRTSYVPFESLERTRLIIRHKKKVDENIPGARSRNIASLFIENASGERFKYPFNHLSGAKAMQVHVANGGVPHDSVGQEIIGLSEQIAQLASFKHYVYKEDLMNGDTNHIVDRANLKLQSLKELMNKLQKQHHYEAFKNDVQTKDIDDGPIMDEATMREYREKFTVKNFKEDIANVFPLLYSIMQETNELDLEEVVKEGTGKPVTINGKQVDVSSLEIDDVDSRDYPDFSDAFLSSGFFVDGTEMSEDELDMFRDQHSDIFWDLAYNSLYESNNPEKMFETWADTIVETKLSPEQLENLKTLVSEHFPLGNNGENVTGSLEEIGIDIPETFKAELASLAETSGPDTDSTNIVIEYLAKNEPEIYSNLNLGDVQEEQQMSQRAQDAFKELDSTITGSKPAGAADLDSQAADFERRVRDGQIKPTKFKDMNPLDQFEWKKSTGQFQGSYQDYVNSLKEATDQTPEERAAARDFIMSVASKIKSGEVSPEEIESEFFNTLPMFGVDDDKAIDAWDRITNTTPKATKPKMSDAEIDAELKGMNSSDEEDDASFLASLKNKAKSGGISQDTTGYGTGLDEVSEEGHSKNKEIAEFIMSFYNREEGNFPLGEKAVAMKVGKEFGERYEKIAEMLCRSMNEERSQRDAFEQLKVLSGMKKPAEGNKFTGNLEKARAAGDTEADLDGDGDMEKVQGENFDFSRILKLSGLK